MNLFVACVPRDRRAIPLYEKAVRQAVPVTVPFAHLPHTEIIWRGPAVVCASFAIHDAKLPIRRNAAHTEDAFVAFNGIPVFDHPEPRPESWAESLLTLYQQNRLDVRRLAGYWNLLLSRGWSVSAATCSSRVEPLYWASNAEAIVLGHRASLVYAVANRTRSFRYDVRALIPLITTGWLCNEATPFEGVRVAEGGMLLNARPGGLAIEPMRPYLFCENDACTEDDLGRLASEITDALVRGMRTFGTLAPEVTINLSGGKDSRMIAALAHAAGIPFRCVTSGREGDRDVIVAREVAAALGVEHQCGPPRPAPGNHDPADIFAIVQRHVRQGDGMTNCFDPIYPIRVRANLLLTGHGGECYRGGYVRTGVRPPLKNERMCLRFLENLSLVAKDHFLRPEAVRAQEEVCSTLVQRCLDEFPARNFYDYAYTKLREGRGVANLRQAAAYGAIAFSPFLNDDALATMWTVPLEHRQTERLWYHMMSRLHPGLAHHRFADSRWKFEADGPLPGGDPAAWRRREPLPETDATLASHSWRLAYDGELRQPICQFLLDNRANPVYQIVDYGKIAQILGSPPPTPRVVMRGIYGVLTAAYLLSEEWLHGTRLA